MCLYMIGLQPVYYSNPRVTLSLVHVFPSVWFMLRFDHCLVYVSPFDWYFCQLIRQITIFKFRTKSKQSSQLHIVLAEMVRIYCTGTPTGT